MNDPLTYEVIEIQQIDDWALVPQKLSMNSVLFEAVMKEDHESTMQISQNPIAYGASITDHSFRDGLKLSLDVVISHFPRTDYEDNTYGYQGDNRPAEFYRELVMLQGMGVLVDAQSSVLVYKNMAIASVKLPRLVDDDNTVIVSIDLQEVKIVNTQTVVYGKQKKPKKSHKKKASKKNNKGASKPTEQVGKQNNAFMDDNLSKGKSYENQFGLKWK